MAESKTLAAKDKQIANLTAMLKEAQARPVAKEEPQAEEVKQNLGGTLEVEVVEAKLERSTEMWGKQDPFAELSIRLQKFKTKTHEDGAKAPVWNETTTMDVLDPFLSLLHSCHSLGKLRRKSAVSYGGVRV